MDEEAIDDAWTVSSYLGDSDIFLAKLQGMLSRYNEAEGVLPSAAASVAVRGVLFGNSHTLSSRLSFICLFYMSKIFMFFNYTQVFLSFAGGMLFGGQSCGGLRKHH